MVSIMSTLGKYTLEIEARQGYVVLCGNGPLFSGVLLSLGYEYSSPEVTHMGDKYYVRLKPVKGVTPISFAGDVAFTLGSRLSTFRAFDSLLCNSK